MKKLPGRPPLSEYTGKKRGRKRKFKMLNSKNGNRSDAESVASDGENNDREKGTMSKYKRKYTHHVPPPSEIKTRAARLPKYSYDRKTHKKILLSYRREHDDGGHRIKARVGHGVGYLVLIIIFFLLKE